MSKYDKLQDYLEEQDTDVIEMTIAELEGVLGFQLPAYSATGQFWQNESNYEAQNRHPQSRAWQRAGFVIEHKLGSDTLRFKRKTS